MISTADVAKCSNNNCSWPNVRHPFLIQLFFCETSLCVTMLRSLCADVWQWETRMWSLFFTLSLERMNKNTCLWLLVLSLYWVRLLENANVHKWCARRIMWTTQGQSCSWFTRARRKEKSHIRLNTTTVIYSHLNKTTAGGTVPENIHIRMQKYVGRCQSTLPNALGHKRRHQVKHNHKLQLFQKTKKQKQNWGTVGVDTLSYKIGG